MEITNETLNRILEVGQSLGAPFDHPAGGKAVLLSRGPAGGFTVERLHEKHELADHVRGTVSFDDVQSFAAYVDRFKTETTVVFGCRDQSQIVANLDYHIDNSKPTQNAHRAILKLRHTPQWRAWADIDNQALPQRDFAEFVEEHVDDIVEPDGARVLEIASSLQTSTKVDFKSATRLHDGTVQFTFNSETQGDSNTVVPTEIKVGLKVYEGQPEGYRITMFMRYRAREGGLSFIVKMKNRPAIIEEAFAQVASEVTQQTGFDVLLGRT